MLVFRMNYFSSQLLKFTALFALFCISPLAFSVIPRLFTADAHAIGKATLPVRDLLVRNWDEEGRSAQVSIVFSQGSTRSVELDGTLRPQSHMDRPTWLFTAAVPESLGQFLPKSVNTKTIFIYFQSGDTTTPSRGSIILRGSERAALPGISHRYQDRKSFVVGR